MPHSAYVCLLDGTTQLPEQIGGKAASLTQLLAMGAPVPPAFALTTEAYRRHTETLGIPPRASTVADADLPAIRARIVAAPLPADIARSMTEILDTMGMTTGMELAVRSSATTEDSPEFSFAGLHDTQLAVDGQPDTVETAIKR